MMSRVMKARSITTTTANLSASSTLRTKLVLPRSSSFLPMTKASPRSPAKGSSTKLRGMLTASRWTK